MGSVIGPTYLAEIAPKSIRGACGIFRELIGVDHMKYAKSGADGMSIYIGIVIGYFASELVLV